MGSSTSEMTDAGIEASGRGARGGAWGMERSKSTTFSSSSGGADAGSGSAAQNVTPPPGTTPSRRSKGTDPGRFSWSRSFSPRTVSDAAVATSAETRPFPAVPRSRSRPSSLTTTWPLTTMAKVPSVSTRTQKADESDESDVSRAPASPAAPLAVEDRASSSSSWARVGGNPGANQATRVPSRQTVPAPPSTSTRGDGVMAPRSGRRPRRRAPLPSPAGLPGPARGRGLPRRRRRQGDPAR